MRIFFWQFSYMAYIESLKHIKIEIAKPFSVWNQNFKDIWWLKYNRQWPRMTMPKMAYQGSVWDIGFWSNISTTMRHWILVKYLIKSTTMIYLDLGQISHQIYIYEKLDSNQIFLNACISKYMKITWCCKNIVDNEHTRWAFLKRRGNSTSILETCLL